MSKAAQKRVEEERHRKLKELDSDPFIGYSTIEEALDDYKCTTQAEVLARLLNRENVFVSGPAGSGKSFVLNRFRDLLDAQFQGNINIALTASTGIAATVIGGQTIHSWGGLGIDTEPFNSAKVSPAVKSKVKTFREVDVLIIDEISMLPAYLFEKLDAILKWARRSTKPFGGVQLVLTGDFLQLPPVSKDTDTVDTSFAITTQAWKDADIHYCYMDKSHRATDKKLKYILAKIAAGKAKNDENTMLLLRSRMGSRKELCSPEKTYATLFTMNRNVDKYNEEELMKNKNPLIQVPLFRDGDKNLTDKIIKAHNLAHVIEYKVGASVILTSNMIMGTGEFLANGSIGQVVGVIGKDPRVRFNDGKTHTIYKKEYPLKEKRTAKDLATGETIVWEETIASVKQLPLKLGYAITVHKSQGQSFPGVVADLSKVFTPGLGYVALSRASSLDDLVIEGWTDKALDLDPLSRKISNFVKKKALAGRAEFIEKIEHYCALLDSDIFRLSMWTK